MAECKALSIVICNSINICILIIAIGKEPRKPEHRGLLERPSCAGLEEGPWGHYGSYLGFGAEPESFVGG